MPNAQPEYTLESMPQPSQHLGMHHARAQDLDPALALAGRAAHAVALVALDVHLAARLGEREVVGTEAGDRALGRRAPPMTALRVPFRSAMVTPLSMTRPSIWWNMGEWVASTSSLRYTRPERDHADGHAVRLHGADLHGRGLGAQQDGAVLGESRTCPSSHGRGGPSGR